MKTMYLTWPQVREWTLRAVLGQIALAACCGLASRPLDGAPGTATAVLSIGFLTAAIVSGAAGLWLARWWNPGQQWVLIAAPQAPGKQVIMFQLWPGMATELTTHARKHGWDTTEVLIRGFRLHHHLSHTYTGHDPTVEDLLTGPRPVA